MKKNKGITLIALVITIIVLLILTGVGIATLTGENGILSKATVANGKTKQEEGREAIILAIDELLAEKLENGEKLTIDYIGDHIHEKLEIEKDNVTKNGEPTQTVDVIYGDYEYEIDDNYQVSILGSLKGKIAITALYEKTGNIGVIHITAQTEDEKGIRRIIKPDGSIQDYANHEKEVSLDYQITQSGNYKFIAEGNNDSKRTKTVTVNDLDYLSVTFDQTNDFLTIENAYNKSKETLTDEAQEIVSEFSNIIPYQIICNAKKIELDNTWTLLGQSKIKVLNNFYLYDKYDIISKTVYEEGPWSEWKEYRLVNPSFNWESRPYESYSFDETSGNYIVSNYNKSISMKYSDIGTLGYHPVPNVNVEDPWVVGQVLIQYKHSASMAAGEARTKGVIEHSILSKGDWKGEIISKEGIYPDDGDYTIDDQTDWYQKKEQAKAYYLYKYDNNEIKTIYDVQNKIINTKKIDFGKSRQSVKILIQADNINYRISISKDNQNWIEIEDKSVLNGETDINLPEQCDNLYIKIEKNNSNISKIVVK